MVDYSKWNNFHDSEDEDERDGESDHPIVHQYDQPQRITIGPKGTSFQSSTTSTTPAPVRGISTVLERNTNNEISSDQLNETPTHSWKQTRHEAEIWIPIPFNTKVSEISIRLFQKKVLQIRIGSLEYFSKEFKYEVEVEEESTTKGGGSGSRGDSVIIDEWEVLTKRELKQIKLCFVKHQYLAGTTIWWSTCFVDDPVIDVMSIPERRMSSQEKVKKQTFSDAWREANETFLQKIEREKSEQVAVGGEEDGEDGENK
jgi:hypothetical protein